MVTDPSPWLLYMNFIVGSIAMWSNLRSALRLWQTFNLRLALYLILFLDACWSTVAFSVLSTTSFLFLAGPTVDKDWFWCNLNTSFFVVSQMLGLCMLSMISVLR